MRPPSSYFCLTNSLTMKIRPWTNIIGNSVAQVVFYSCPERDIRVHR